MHDRNPEIRIRCRAEGERTFCGRSTTTLSPVRGLALRATRLRRITHRGLRRRQESWYGTGFLLAPHSKTEHRATEDRWLARKPSEYHTAYTRLFSKLMSTTLSHEM